MDDFFDDGFDWEDMAIIGSMAEDIADEEIKRIRIEREFERDQADDIFNERNDDL